MGIEVQSQLHLVRIILVDFEQKMLGIQLFFLQIYPTQV